MPDVEVTVQDRELRPMRRDAVRNQKLVLQAAREVIAELGTEASIEVIATRAGVGVGTVYRHYPNKQALISEMIHEILGDLVITARAALDRGDGTGLESYLHALGASFTEHHRYAQMLVGQTTSQDAELLRSLMAALLAQAQHFGLINDQVVLGDIMATVWALRGIVETTADVAPGAWERHLDLHLAGLRAPQLQTDRPAVTREQLSRISYVDQRGSRSS
ncbi:MAG: transcriptional regulator, TetR family [Frankiales bacterium]|jgi:AcrR family transcriptional regulator|nr:transcriptional regulator, TetR family [Frankiales bacterium]